MLEEQSTTLLVLSDMAQAAKAQKKTMAVRARAAASGPCGRGGSSSGRLPASLAVRAAALTRASAPPLYLPPSLPARRR
jgi:hypothetical protein